MVIEINGFEQDIYVKSTTKINYGVKFSFLSNSTVFTNGSQWTLQQFQRKISEATNELNTNNPHIPEFAAPFEWNQVSYHVINQFSLVEATNTQKSAAKRVVITSVVQVLFPFLFVPFITQQLSGLLSIN